MDSNSPVKSLICGLQILKPGHLLILNTFSEQSVTNSVHRFTSGFNKRGLTG